jgi:hypothetical protein
MMGSLGVITSYNRTHNTASVAITENDTDEIREILTNVPCPVMYGVQGVAPTPGKLCYVLFKNGNIQSPLIVGIYNHRYQQFDYERQNNVRFTLPYHLMD